METRLTFEKQISILLIEEDLNEQTVFKNFFNAREERYKYTISAGVEDTLQKINETNFDVIISDIAFIDGNIFDILPHTRDIPFIIITAKGDEEIAIKVIQRGASEYVLRDVERKYLRILPSLILRAARYNRGKMITEFLFKTLQGIDECVCVLTADRLIVFANRSFCNIFLLKGFYYLVDIKTALKNFEISGEPDIETYFKEEIKAEAWFEIRAPYENREGRIRLRPFLDGKNFILGYVLFGNLNGN